MIAVFEEVESNIARLITDDNEIVYLSSKKLPSNVKEGDVLEIIPADDGWQVVRLLPNEKEERIKKSKELREKLKKK